MPVYKDEKTNTWYCKFYYQDYTGTRRQKMKRGFKLQRDAKEWERAFLEHQAATPDMTFGTLYDIYIKDMEGRLKPSTLQSKRSKINNHILPYFKKKPVNKITAADVRLWQQNMLEKDLEPTTMYVAQTQLSAIFNYAVRFYNLPKNPCTLAGHLGTRRTEKKPYWTKQQFDTFINAVSHPMYKTLFYILFYAGLRIGEALALTPADIDLEKRLIYVSKTYYRGKGKHQILTPKSINSKRVVSIPDFLAQIVKTYISGLYGLRDTDYLFYVAETNVRQAMLKACKESGVEYIRVHGLRHSHVSLLINMGVPAMLIAERIGDTVKMVNETYGHLYPTRHEEVAKQLDDLVSN